MGTDAFGASRSVCTVGRVFVACPRLPPSLVVERGLLVDPLLIQLEAVIHLQKNGSICELEQASGRSVTAFEFWMVDVINAVPEEGSARNVIAVRRMLTLRPPIYSSIPSSTQTPNASSKNALT